MIAVPCKDYDSENVYAAVRSGIRALGGMKAFLRPEERVLVKPNLLKPADADSAVTTHPGGYCQIPRSYFSLNEKES